MGSVGGAARTCWVALHRGVHLLGVWLCGRQGCRRRALRRPDLLLPGSARPPTDAGLTLRIDTQHPVAMAGERAPNWACCTGVSGYVRLLLHPCRRGPGPSGGRRGGGCAAADIVGGDTRSRPVLPRLTAEVELGRQLRLRCHTSFLEFGHGAVCCIDRGHCEGDGWEIGRTEGSMPARGGRSVAGFRNPDACCSGASRRRCRRSGSSPRRQPPLRPPPRARHDRACRDA